jgi:hypothetical protein
VVRIHELLISVWGFLREACGENDYARYRAHVLARGGKPQPPGDFYLEKLNKKYSTPNRCC